MNRMEQLYSFREDADKAFKDVKSFISNIIDELSFVETDAFLFDNNLQLHLDNLQKQ